MKVESAWFDLVQPERLNGHREEITGEIVLDFEGGLELVVDARGIVNRRLGKILLWEHVLELIEREGVGVGALPVDA